MHRDLACLLAATRVHIPIERDVNDAIGRASRVVHDQMHHAGKHRPTDERYGIPRELVCKTFN